MKKTYRLLVATLICGLISLICFIFGRLALTDIFHGEPDLTLEWKVVSLSFLPILIFHILAVLTSVVAMRQLPRKDA